LRTITTRDRDRLTPAQRLVDDQAELPVAFARLLLEEGWVLSNRHPEAALPLTHWCATLVDFFGGNLVEGQQENLDALKYLYLAEAHILTNQPGPAAELLADATALVEMGDSDPEILAFSHQVTARLCIKQGRFAAAAQRLQNASELLAAPEMWERRVEVLIDRGALQCQRHQRHRGIATLQQALEVLKEQGPEEAPMLRLATLHALAMAQVEGWRRLPDEQRHTVDPELTHYLEAASELYETYGCCEVRAQGNLLWAWIESVRQPTRAAAFFRRAAEDYREAQEPLNEAQTLFEMLEFLDRFADPAQARLDEILAELRSLCDQHPEVQEHFEIHREGIEINLGAVGQTDDDDRPLPRKLRLICRLLGANKLGARA
jgi:tetratricopeptide (TPR) repeat protein